MAEPVAVLRVVPDLLIKLPVVEVVLVLLVERDLGMATLQAQVE